MSSGRDRNREEPADRAQRVCLSAHPRAARALRQARGWGALVGFALGALLTWRAGLSPFDMAMRGLLGAAGGCLVAWAGALALWRQLALTEIRALTERHEARRRAGAAPGAPVPESS